MKHKSSPHSSSKFLCKEKGRSSPSLFCFCLRDICFCNRKLLVAMPHHLAKLVLLDGALISTVQVVKASHQAARSREGSSDDDEARGRLPGVATKQRERERNCVLEIQSKKERTLHTFEDKYHNETQQQQITQGR